ncbi:MAG: hypothetical protein NTW52_04570 [Planctomycetota bacterium]|nr:hypothetical protein [Planctomycetota bacterium]
MQRSLLMILGLILLACSLAGFNPYLSHVIADDGVLIRPLPPIQSAVIDDDLLTVPLPPVEPSSRSSSQLIISPSGQSSSQAPSQSSGQVSVQASGTKSVPPMTPTGAWLWESHSSQQTDTKLGQVYCPQPVPPPTVAVAPPQRSVYETPWVPQNFGSLFENIPPMQSRQWRHQQPTRIQGHEPNSISGTVGAEGACNKPTAGCVPSASPVPYQAYDFRGTPAPAEHYMPEMDIATYYGKYFVPTQRPWVEWWRPFYTGGMYDPAIPVFSDVNPLTPHFLVYGDYRAGVGVHHSKGKPVRSVANRLNLDLDLRLTGTERIHAFTGPLDNNNQFTRLDFSDSRNVRFESELDFQFDTLFFEGDLGAMTGGLAGVDAPFDLPFTFGQIPLLYQNGIWMEDAITGVAFGFPWRNSRALNWSNYDVTFFAGFNQVTSPAFENNNQAAQVFGTAWFIEAYDGYIEADYAFLSDQDGLERSYHNMALAYTRRYFTKFSNSIRVLGNIGQEGARTDRTADGFLLLCENSLISYSPSNVVPYFNAFLGYGRPQSVARAAGAGGILRNTGINFESDLLTGYPTLDTTGSNSYGGAVGLNLLTADFRRQLAFEFAALDTYGDPVLSSAPGAQYAIGTRWQRTLNNWTLVRVDLMNAWLDNASDLYGTRCEFRWKF